MLRKGVFLDLDSVDRGDLSLESLRQLIPGWRMDNQRGVLRPEQVGDAEVLVVNKIIVGGETLARCPELRLVCVAATGVNNIDLDGAKAAGITVCNARSYATPSVVEHVFGLILSLSHRLREHSEAARRNRWSDSGMFCLLDYPFAELRGRTLGVFGYGELGRAVAEIARAFGMTVLVSERRGKKPRSGRVPFDECLSQSDVLSLHCPLTDETQNLIGAPELELMKRGALLINTARGGIVNETALLDALRNGHLGGAGIDVLTEEPPPQEDPLATADISNLIVTPHVAWAGRGARQQLIEEIAENIQAFDAGQPRNVVT